MTTDPASKTHPIVEGAGTVTSDSLAAESTTAHGGFSANRDAEPSSVPSKSTTANNTDTSAAKVLPPAPDSEHRKDRTEQSSDTQHEHKHTHAEQHKHHQSHPTEHASHTASTSSSSGNHQAKGGADHSSSQGMTPAEKAHLNEDHGHVPIAPSYVQADVYAARDPHNKPKGKNLTEGIDDDGKNASFSTDIGGENDPGRAAEQKFERSNASAGFEEGPRQKKLDGAGTYDVLAGKDGEAP